MEEKTNLPAVKPLGETSISELTGVTSKGGDIVLVNLNRASLVIDCGSRDDFLHAVDMCNGIKAAVWNEEGILLALADRYTVVKYEPAIHKAAKVFFEPMNHNSYSRDSKEWKGDYKPVEFTKTDLIRFLTKVSVTGGTQEIVEAVKKMKLRETRSEADLISLDEDKTTSITEDAFETNIPKKFSLVLPVTPDFSGRFDFEARVERPSERGGEPKQRKIALHCLNPLEIQREAIKHVLDALPKEIPRLYGKMKIHTGDRWLE